MKFPIESLLRVKSEISNFKLTDMSEEFLPDLIDRIGKHHLTKRLSRQNQKNSFYAKLKKSPFYLEHVKLTYVILKLILKCLGIYKNGIQNAHTFKIEQTKVFLKNLPNQFNGFKILQISDIHAELFSDNGNRLLDAIKELEADLCVITGDYYTYSYSNYKNNGNKEAPLKIIEKMVKTINAPHGIFGILGNHDFIDFVPQIESIGVNMLLNEAVPIVKEKSEIWLAGIDDAHMYHCDDISKAIKIVPPESLTILLSHTPETYIKAAKACIDYFICGHTHGGQVCLPGGKPIFTSTRCPKEFCSGQWEFENMLGYTSRGVGCSGLDVRFHCTPEITIHELTSI